MENVVIWGAFLVVFWVLRGALRGPLGSQMVDLGRQDTDWVGGNVKERLDAILLPDGIILVKKTQNLMKSARILLTIS